MACYCWHGVRAGGFGAIVGPMAIAPASRVAGLVLALGLACTKGLTVIVDFARELPVVGVEARAAGAEVEIAASDADASLTATRMEQADAWAQDSGEMRGGQPEDNDDRRAAGVVPSAAAFGQLGLAQEFATIDPPSEYKFILPPELQ